MAKRQKIVQILKLESKSIYYTQILDLLFNKLKTSTEQQVRDCDRVMEWHVQW